MIYTPLLTFVYKNRLSPMLPNESVNIVTKPPSQPTANFTVAVSRSPIGLAK